MDETDLLRRAMAAYWRGRGGDPAVDQPSASSGVEVHDGKAYVVLRNVRGVLAVYRVRNDGMLKGMRRWPKSIED